MFPIDFQVVWSKVKVKPMIIIPSVVYSISLTLLDGYHTSYTGWLWEYYPSIIHYPIAFWVKKSKYLSLYHHCLLKILWTIHLIIKKYGTVATREWVIHYMCNPYEFCSRGAFIFLIKITIICQKVRKGYMIFDVRASSLLIYL